MGLTDRYGIRAFDTAPFYGPSEIILGNALQALAHAFPRSSYQIVRLAVPKARSRLTRLHHVTRSSRNAVGLGTRGTRSTIPRRASARASRGALHGCIPRTSIPSTCTTSSLSPRARRRGRRATIALRSVPRQRRMAWPRGRRRSCLGRVIGRCSRRSGS